MSSTSIKEARRQSLVRFVMGELRDGNSPSLDLAEVITALQMAVKAVSAVLRTSTFGEGRSARDVAAEIFLATLQTSATTGLVVCDTKETPLEADGDRRGKYAVCVNPLDTDSGSPEPPAIAGSIFGVYRCLEGIGPCIRSALQAGRNLVAAGYALYGNSTLMVLSLGQGVNLFMLDPILGELVMVAMNLAMPIRGRTYSVDEGLTYEWGDPVVEYVESKKDPKLGTPYQSHHVGSAVADVHHILRFGGIYLSPLTRSSPQGKLKLALEAVPLAHILCRAGGLATDGRSSLLDCVPDGISHRSAAFMGSRDDVRDLLSMFRRYGLCSARPSNQLATAITPTPSLLANNTARSEKDKKSTSLKMATAGLSASVAVLSASVAALATSPSRPVSAASGIYPASKNNSQVITPQRPMSAAGITGAGAITPVSGAISPIRNFRALTILPHSLPSSMTSSFRKVE